MGKKIKSFSITEILIVMMVLGIIMAISMPLYTIKKQLQGYDTSSIACIKSELAANPSLDISESACASNPTSPCCKAVNYCRYSQNNACSTLAYYADKGTTAQEIANARKALATSCERGGKDACKYFSNECKNDSTSCDIAGSDYDLHYFLNIALSSSILGKFRIIDIVDPYYDYGFANITAQTDSTCTANPSSIACYINGTVASAGAPEPPPSPPTAPSGLTAVAGTSGYDRTVALNWTDNSSDETAFRVFQAIGGGSYTQVGSDLAAGTITYTVNLGNTPAVEDTYHYKIVAVNANGTSDSNIADVLITPPAPAEPSGLTAVAGQSGTDRIVELNWTDNAGSETTYRIYMGFSYPPSLQVGGDLPANTVSYTHNLGTPAFEGTYYYQVVAVGAGGQSSTFTTVFITIPPPPVGTNGMCWGYGSQGKLGTGNTTNQSTPVDISGNHTWASLSEKIGGDHTCAIDSSGKAWCWGVNDFGKLGIGNTTDQYSPTNVTGTQNWHYIDAGYRHSCGLDTSGKAWCWGYNVGGALGTNNTTNQLTPAEVTGNKTWRSISAGGAHTCAIENVTNKIWCWGYGYRVGTGNTVNQTSPQEVSGTWSSLSAGFTHTCAIENATNQLYCWGDNSYGQLGIGSTKEKLIPTLVTGTWSFVSSGGEHTCGIDTSGNAWCWGDNAFGELGIGSTKSQDSPTAVSSSDTWLSIAAGMEHTCGIVNTTGKAWCWGYGSYGRLGTGNTVNQSTPTAVSGNNTWSSINAGVYHSCGMLTQ